MRASFQTLALFGLAAVNAAPIAQPTDYSSLWAEQQASMVSVQNAMGGGKAAATPTAAAEATGKAAAQTTVIPSVVKATSTITAAATGKAAAASSPAATAASSAAATSSSSSSGSSSGGSGAQVTNQQAFSNGAATKNPSAGGSGPSPVDGYKCYAGGVSGFPTQDKWSSFDDLWQANQKLLSEACTNLGDGADDTQEQIGYIHDGILQVSGDSYVDPRFILAIIMQESHGCVNVGTTNNGVSNPGIMQSHNGVSFSSSDPKGSITQMIRDGTQGTASGDGLVQLINKYGDVFSAARGYNSGTVTESNLNAGNGATASYVNDVANRLTGWSLTPGTSPTCPGES